MTVPVVRRCPDAHFRRVIYDLAAYIADYPEQVYLAGIVQNWCPKYAVYSFLHVSTLTQPIGVLHFLQILMARASGVLVHLPMAWLTRWTLIGYGTTTGLMMTLW